MMVNTIKMYNLMNVSFTIKVLLFTSLIFIKLNGFYVMAKSTTSSDNDSNLNNYYFDNKNNINLHNIINESSNKNNYNNNIISNSKYIVGSSSSSSGGSNRNSNFSNNNEKQLQQRQKQQQPQQNNNNNFKDNSVLRDSYYIDKNIKSIFKKPQHQHQGHQKQQPSSLSSLSLSSSSSHQYSIQKKQFLPPSPPPPLPPKLKESFLMSNVQIINKFNNNNNNNNKNIYNHKGVDLGNNNVKNLADSATVSSISNFIQNDDDTVDNDDDILNNEDDINVYSGMDSNYNANNNNNDNLMNNKTENIHKDNSNHNNKIIHKNTNNNENENENDELTTTTLSLSDQVQLLSKQLNALMTRRREDYKLLENSLKKSISKNLLNNDENYGIIDVNIRAEIEELRNEIKTLRQGDSIIGGGNKERLTIEWLTQSIAEIRKELTELQEIASNASADLNRRSQTFEDLATIKNDFKQYKLELEALKQRQETTEVLLRELKDESIQKEEDLRKMIRHQSEMINQHNKVNIDVSSTKNNGNNGGDYIIIEPPSQLSSSSSSSELADHRMRHQRYLRQQIHELELSQHSMKRQLNELKYHRISDRVHNLEIEQRRLANANFNLSRQIVGLDKLHSSMLELLEDVEGIQNKMDKQIPDIKREISKLEFTSAQINSEQNLLKEEGHNAAKSIQAMAVSVSALQEERDVVKDLQNSVQKLQQDFERLQSITDIQKSIVQRRIQKIETEANPSIMNLNHNSITSSSINNNSINELENHNSIQMANNLVQQLESVEQQYESIINKLPLDCSQVDHKVSNDDDDDNDDGGGNGNNGGLYLIAPSGQHRPQLAHCTKGGWTTIQRRYDGSIDFNRSWEDYAKGFGSPSGEFWIGNEAIHHLTSDNCTKLKIIMQDIYDNIWEAIYEYFYVSSRDDGYRLHVSNYKGNASDALDYQNKMQFSAIDVDRDISNTHCAANYEGGWWFSHCQHANLNGRYNLGLTWFDGSRNEWIAVKSSQMMINKMQQCNSNNNSYSSNPMATESSTTTITSVV